MPAPAHLVLTFSPGNIHTFRSLDSTSPPQHANVVGNVSGKVYRGLIGLRGQEATKMVAMKIARGQEQARLLYHEAQVYQTELKHLQGTIVPKYYGTFVSRIEHNDVAVMVLEYCGNTPQQMAMQQIPDDEYT